MASGYIRKRERRRGQVYEIGLTVVDPATGKRRERTQVFKTRREAVAALATWRTEAEKGTLVERSTHTVGQVLRYWLDTAVIPYRRGTTTDRYRVTIEKHLIPGLGSVPLQKLTPAHVHKFYADKQASGTGKRSLVFCHQRLHQALDMAVRLGWASRNVCDAVTPPRYERKPKPIWNREELDRFLEAARASGYGPIWLVLALTGMRRGEVLGLRWSDIDFDTGVINVSQTYVSRSTYMAPSTPKTRAGHRTIPMEPILADTLREHRIHQRERRLSLGEVWQDHDLVFPSEVGTPILAGNLHRHYRHLIEKAGVANITIHGIRHTVATLSIAAGQDIRTLADLLGHSRTSITTDIYAHVLPHRKRELTRALTQIVLGEETPLAQRSGDARKQ